MQVIKQSRDGFVVVGVETHRVSSNSKVIYCSDQGTEHDALTVLMHIIDNLKAIHKIDYTAKGDSVFFRVGLFKYNFTMQRIGGKEKVSQLFTPDDLLKSHADEGAFPSEFTANAPTSADPEV